MGCLTVLVVQRRETVSIPIPDAGPLAQDSREEDRKFWDDLVQKHKARTGIFFPQPFRPSAKLGQLIQALRSPAGGIGYQ